MLFPVDFIFSSYSTFSSLTFSRCVFLPVHSVPMCALVCVCVGLFLVYFFVCDSSLFLAFGQHSHRIMILLFIPIKMVMMIHCRPSDMNTHTPSPVTIARRSLHHHPHSCSHSISRYPRHRRCRRLPIANASFSLSFHWLPLLKMCGHISWLA